MKLSRLTFEKIKQAKDKSSLSQKKKLIVSLKKLKEEYTGNIGGETDIRNPDNLMVAEEYDDQNVIAASFETNNNFEKLTQEKRGIQLTDKDKDSINNYSRLKPSSQDNFSIKYELNDDFGHNSIIVIKKLKKDNSLCWTAFVKYKNEEIKTPSNGKPMGSNEKIKIFNSIPFDDDIKGAEILYKFIEKINS